jgi:CubicO group peptidase (beta-lactamase class C family)
MTGMPEIVDRVATDTGFSGVVRVDPGDGDGFEAAYGLADRAHGIPMTVDTRLAIASGTKGFTALAVMSLVVDGTLDLGTTARSLLGDDLPLIAPDVTVEHLLAHTSGIGDYLDEESGLPISAYVLPVPGHRLAAAEDYLAILDGYPTAFPAGERFVYCNGGYVVLAVLAERAAGVPYHDLVRQRVLEPAGIPDVEFLRSDGLPGDAALGYVDVAGVERSNVLHLPVRGVGDGGLYATVADVHRFWAALMAGRIVPAATVAEMVRPRNAEADGGFRYGLGFWLTPEGSGVGLEGYDAGVSFRSRHDPTTGTTWTVVGNTSEGAWPVAKAIGEALATARG